MASPIFDTHRTEHNILENIREGMKVYDANNAELGKVDFVYLGEASPEAVDSGDVPGTVSRPMDDANPVVTFARGLLGKDELPDVLRARLLLHGFIHIEGKGLLAHDRYILADQIADAAGDRVMLRATRAETIKD